MEICCGFWRFPIFRRWALPAAVLRQQIAIWAIPKYAWIVVRRDIAVFFIYAPGRTVDWS